MADYAYVRVSTKEQNIDRQLASLEPYKIPKKTFSVIISLAKILPDRPIRRC